MLDALVEHLPSRWNRYFEPMAGGAALFFRLRPSSATLADINDELINFYTVLQSQADRLVVELSKLKACQDLYYRVRRYNPRTPLRRAVRFAYLNRLAWNGLYRVNRKGLFNVPIGDRLPERLWNFDELRAASSALATATLRTADVVQVLNTARRDDFVFLDPPYPRGAADVTGFNRYSAAVFTTDDHKRLSDGVKRLSSRGVKVMIVVADRAEYRRLYPTEMRTVVVKSKALIACNGGDRRDVAELILVNY